MSIKPRKSKAKYMEKSKKPVPAKRNIAKGIADTAKAVRKKARKRSIK